MTTAGCRLSHDDSMSRKEEEGGCQRADACTNHGSMDHRDTTVRAAPSRGGI